MSSPTFFGDCVSYYHCNTLPTAICRLTKPRGPIFGASDEVAPTSPPTALRNTSHTHTHVLLITTVTRQSSVTNLSLFRLDQTWAAFSTTWPIVTKVNEEFDGNEQHHYNAKTKGLS